MNTNSIAVLETFYRWNDALLGAPVGVLVLFACVALGYALKLLPFVDNKWIPLVVIVGGMTLFPMISERAAAEPWRVWLGKTTAFGMIVACAAWLLHNRLLKLIEQKLGWFQSKENKP